MELDLFIRFRDISMRELSISRISLREQVDRPIIMERRLVMLPRNRLLLENIVRRKRRTRLEIELMRRVNRRMIR